MSDERLATYYAQAALFVFPSLYEGFGIPPLEAMSKEIPVIASDIPVVREVCGDAVMYFIPFNADELAKKIDTLYGSPMMRRELIQKGKERIQLYSTRLYEQKVLGVLKKSQTLSFLN